VSSPTEPSILNEARRPVDRGEGPETEVGSRARAGVRFGAWTGIAQQAMSVVATLVLARLLTPADFGVVAAVQSAVGAGTLLLGVGFGTSIIRSETADTRFLSTLFYSGLALSSAVAAAFVVFSGPLSRAVGVPTAQPYLVALAPTLAIGVAGAVVRGLLIRQLRYRLVIGIELASAAGYFAVELVLAWLGLGAWAVIIGLIVGQLVRTGGLLLAGRWLPRPMFSWAMLRGQLSFSAGYLGANGLGYVFKNMDYWAVGHILGTRALGQYYVAFVLPDVLRTRIVSATSEVITASVAHLRRTSANVAHAYLRSVRLAAVVAMPVMLGIVVVAQPLMLTVFGRTWAPAVAPLRILAVAVLVDAVSGPAAAVLLALATPRLLFGLSALRVAVMAAGLAVVLLRPSLTGVAVAVLVATVVASTPAFFLGGRHVGAGARAALLAAFRPLPATGLCCLAAAAVLAVLTAAGPLPRLVSASLAGGVVYVAAMWGTGGAAREDLVEAVRLLLPVRRRR
jgi:O-antigen/teichoic acid export membrane protein